jgi:hypothetical protein
LFPTSRPALVLIAAAILLTAGCISVAPVGSKSAEPAGSHSSGREASADARPEPFAGPIPYRSMMPLSIIFPHPMPDRASPLPAEGMKLEVNADYASIYIEEVHGAESILVDGEFMRTAFAFRVGLGRVLGREAELGVEVPLLHYTGGFMDSFIMDWHDFFGMSQGNRDRVSNNQYGVAYADDSGTFFTADENGVHLGDIPVTLKVGVLDPAEDDFGLAVRGLVELPAGSESRGFGSGKVDGGVGFLAEKRFDRLAVYLAVDEVFRKNPDSFDGLHVAHVTHASLAAEYAVSRAVSVILQTDYQTAPLKNASLTQFEDPQWMGGLGAAFRLSDRSLFRIAFEEGLTTDTTPDFTISAGYAILF